MLTEWFVNMALGLVAAVAGFIPELPVDLSGVADVFAFAMTLDGVAPMTEMLAGGSLLLSVTGLMFGWRVLRVLLSHVPAIGGSG
jgi:hypothetical protein